MDVEQLIEEISKYPVLYDQCNEKYRNTDHKDRVWKNIATKLDVKGGVDECKKKWNSIRDQLRRTVNKRKTKSGQAAAKIRKYKYEDILTFLLPHLSEKEGGKEDFGINFCENSQDISSKGTHQKTNINNTGELHTEGEKEIAETSKETAIRPRESCQLNFQVPQKFAISSPTQMKISGHDIKEEESPTSQLMAFILEEKKAQKQKASSSKTCQQHPVDAFLCAIAPTLKSLDAILLNEAKGKIFTIVQELELRQLQESSKVKYCVTNYLTSPSHSSSSSPILVQTTSPLTSSHITTADQTTN